MNLYESMNYFLADNIVMNIKLHNLHWYIQGSSFFTLHAKFEELYDQTNEIMDETAERILAIEQKPVSSLKKALELAKISELEDNYIQAKESIEILKTDLEHFVTDCKNIVTLAEEEQDVVTADLFTGYLKEYEKTLWMLHAFTK